MDLAHGSSVKGINVYENHNESGTVKNTTQTILLEGLMHVNIHLENLLLRNKSNNIIERRTIYRRENSWSIEHQYF